MVSVPSSEQVSLNPMERAIAVDRSEDDEYSDENIEEWLEEDILSPELAEWLKVQLEG
jgi:hypothetical protein